MSAIAAARVALGAPVGRIERTEAVRLLLRLATFAAIAGFCLAHFALLVVPPAQGQTLALVAVATAGGATLFATAGLPRGRGLLLRVAIVAAMAVIALAVTGLAPRLLLPGNWGALSDGLNRGFAGLDTFDWPLHAGDPWVRLTVLLAMPLLVVPAAALAFWPLRRGAGPVRVLALAPLLIAYGTGVTNLALSGWALRGSALLLLIAAYLWLPGLHGRDRLVASGAVAVCCVVALPLASGLNARSSWIDYRNWDWFSSRAAGTTFTWDHTYGPIGWSRTGVKLLDVSSPQPHYWKAETLDRFNGLRWLHSEATFKTGDATPDIPQPIPRGWDERITFTVRHLTTQTVVGAGTIYNVQATRAVDAEPDGTVRILDSPLRQGDHYTVSAYVPDPSAAQMRAAPKRYPESVTSYTWFDLPAPGDSGLKRPDLVSEENEPILNARTIGASRAGQPLAPDAARLVLRSPYGRMYRLAQKLAVNQPTTYDTVKSVEAYLQRFEYSEHPPQRRYPLDAFLFQDKIGYCQQFSGAMALMLRMDGIPARVASGFAPGSYNARTKEYEVRDLDAHSWVEVWFTGIGWVPFDPTPSLAPAGSQSSGENALSAARGGRADLGPGDRKEPARVTAAGGGASSGADVRLWLAIGLLSVITLAALAALWLAGVLRARPHFAATADGAVDELRAALARLGYAHPARTTLRELEQRLRVTAGEPAARYVANLRRLRYAAPGAGRPPGARDRRELRRSLTGGHGILTRIRGLVVLPPHPRRRAF